MTQDARELARAVVGSGWGLLEMRPMIYLGQISYGLYLVHTLTPQVVAWLWRLSNPTSDYPPNAFVGVGAPACRGRWLKVR